MPRRRLLKFAIVVPAHDEEGGIARTVQSLQQVAWPAECRRIVVVADNCTDATAARAAVAGALVLERQDDARRGKGYALDHAFTRCMAEQWADAVVVVDADSVVSPNFLEAIAARLECGELAVQVRYGVLNVGDSWRTRLMAIALAAFHDVRSRARERFGFSCGIRGNGWCLSRECLRRVPYGSFSLVEDVEYGIALGVNGIRVAYVDEADVRGEMVSRPDIAARQRQRWEAGRLQLIRGTFPALLRGIFTGRSRVCLDLLLDLLVLPLAHVALCVVLLAGCALALALAFAANAVLGGLALLCTGSLIAYVLRGWALSGTGSAGLADLLRAPGYVLWKVLLLLRRGAPTAWIRTDRETR